MESEAVDPRLHVPDPLSHSGSCEKGDAEEHQPTQLRRDSDSDREECSDYEFGVLRGSSRCYWGTKTTKKFELLKYDEFSI